jgi:glycosyltransferase involved in cell wall biosynthesis
MNLLKKSPKLSVTIVVLAYNEEKNLTPTIEGIIGELPKITDYEILIIDDGSKDKTGSVADSLAKKYDRIRVVHHRNNLGFGMAFKDGIENAHKEYVIGFPGDNDTSPTVLTKLVESVNNSDIVSCYPQKNNLRSSVRETISGSFVKAMNVFFGMNLKYYNGSFICRTETLRHLKLYSKGFAIYAEAKVRLIKRGSSCYEVPFVHIGRKYGSSKAVNLRSLVHTVDTMLFLVREVYFTNL